MSAGHLRSVTKSELGLRLVQDGQVRTGCGALLLMMQIPCNKRNVDSIGIWK